MDSEEIRLRNNLIARRSYQKNRDKFLERMRARYHSDPKKYRQTPEQIARRREIEKRCYQKNWEKRMSYRKNYVPTPEQRKRNDESNKRYKERNKEKTAAIQKAWRERNIGKVRAKALSIFYSPKGKFSAYKCKARDRRISFELSFEEFIQFWKKPCEYCGDEIKTIGLDRIDSKIGYAISNVVPCCARCNRSKLAGTREDFISMCRRVAILHPE